MRSLGAGLAMTVMAALAIGGFLVVPGLIVSAPIEPVMGVVQKIFYFHVPCAIMLFLSTFTCAGGSVAYLFRGSVRGDRVAAAAGELAVLFGACVLVSGPLWGRKAWGVYWQWDARLTSSLLLFLIMIAYMLARRYGGPGGKRLAAALALFAAVDVPLVYKSVDIWRTVHPQTTVVPSLDPRMRPAFWASFALIMLVWGLLLALRMRLEKARTALGELRLEMEDLLEARR
ncbi:MAG TPA: cytochrome c biogenesis protein CcsA [Polyangia bacterium]|nr:cytochrome c biogenesis protein CcsA [Polyangia bacterium]